MPISSFFKRKAAKSGVKDPTVEKNPFARTPKEPTDCSPSNTPTQKSDVQISTRASDPKSEAKGYVQTSAVRLKHHHDTIFSGAPQFLVEKGEIGKYHPQVVFLWDKTLDVDDLSDHNAFRHQTSTAATLHAHLPIPEIPLSPSVGRTQPHETAIKKRPAFGVGIFEVPNMVDAEGNEPGTVGMRHFLELSVRDSLITAEMKEKERVAANALQLKRMSNTDAMRILKRDGTNVLTRNTWWERSSLARNRKLWKEIGIREISIGIIQARAAVIKAWYDKNTAQGWSRTILDETDADSLHDELFTMMLYPPQGDKSAEGSVAQQIHTLVDVLSMPGAWFDFSLVHSRLQFGKVLWELPMEHGIPARDSGADRHWLLIQILLSIELAIRLDALLRDHQSHLSESASNPGMECYCSRRNDKVDWDIIMARTFIDHDFVEIHPRAFPQTAFNVQKRAQTTGIFSKWKQNIDDAGENNEISPWDLIIFPRALDVQVEGLLRFAAGIHWPNKVDFENRLRNRIHRFATAKTFTDQVSFFEPLQDSSESSPMKTTTSPLLSRKSTMTGTEILSTRVTLRPASDFSSGGWLSRSWFTGLILPGESIYHVLISALFEHDPEAIKTVGSHADLNGGFVLGGQSWWSKSSIVGKVMAASEDAAEYMGWIRTPHVQPLDQSIKPLSNGWLTVRSQPIHAYSGKARINDGRAIMDESNPLGPDLRAAKKTHQYRMLNESAPSSQEEVEFERLVLRNSGAADSSNAAVTLKFKSPKLAKLVEVQWELTNDACFISANACRVPDPKAVASILHQSTTQRDCTAILLDASPPCHPLHSSFHFRTRGLSDLLEWVPASSHASNAHEVCIIDARGAKSKEVLARAWCSKVGQHALISRVGRTCLSCTIREAYALGVEIVIRVDALP